MSSPRNGFVSEVSERLWYCCTNESVGDEKMGKTIIFMGNMECTQAICEPGAGQVT